ncbi:hypothetical protein [Flavobacterium pedocola]
MISKKIICAPLIALFCASCSTFHETHYFKDNVVSVKNEKLVSNYYKVNISGFSFLSSSRYLSGYFNQEAIDLYFNEIKQPADAKIFNTEEKNGNQALVTNEDGNELVLIFSTNAKAISDQIGNIAKNQVVLNSLAVITQKEKLMEATEVQNKISDADSDIQNFILQTDLYLDNLDAKPKNEIKTTVNQYLNSVSK